MLQSPALTLARWVLVSARQPLTHLKLQKLVFYSYGAALAFDRENEVGMIAFQAWEHGPVSVELWRHYCDYKAETLPVPTMKPRYSDETEQHLQDAVDVYARLSAWNIRNESHLERPWRSNWERQVTRIDPYELKQYFKSKFGSEVQWPEHLGRPSSLALDGLPREKFRSLHELAELVRSR